MIIALWIVVPILSYIFVAGLLKTPFAKLSTGKCKKCYDGNHHWVDDNSYRTSNRETSSAVWHANDGAGMAAAWPFTLPWTLGSIITGSDRAGNKRNKAEARRANEIDEAEHQAKLARIRADEDAHLTRQLQDK